MPRRATFLEKLDAWKLDLESANYSPGTVETYLTSGKLAWRYACQKGWPQDPRKWTPGMVRDYLEYLRRFSTNTQANYVRMLLLFLKFAGNTQFEKFRLGIAVERSRVDWLTEDEVSVVLRTAPSPEIKAMELVFVYTGIRECELASLRVADVTRDFIIVRGKGSKARKVPLTEQFWISIRPYMEWRVRQPGALFMMHPAGPGYPLGPYTVDGIKSAIRRHWKASSRHLSPHTFRRSYGTHLYKRGMPLPDIQKLYGHRRVETTIRYLGITEEDLARSVSKFQPVY